MTTALVRSLTHLERQPLRASPTVTVPELEGDLDLPFFA